MLEAVASEFAQAGEAGELLLSARAAAEQMPGFAILLHASGGVCFVGIERDEALNGLNAANGDEIPGAAGDNEDRHEINFFGGVADGRIGVGDAADIAASVGEAGGAADLDAVERLATADDEIEGGGVAVGLGHGKALVGGTRHELHLDPLADEFGRGLFHGSFLGLCFWWD